MTDFEEFIRHPVTKLSGIVGGAITAKIAFAEALGSFVWFHAQEIFTFATLLSTASGKLGIPQGPITAVLVVAVIVAVTRVGYRLLSDLKRKL